MVKNERFILILFIFIICDIISCKPSYQSGINGNVEVIQHDSLDLSDVLKHMKNVILGSRYLYLMKKDEITQEMRDYYTDKGVLNIPLFNSSEWDLEIVESNKQNLYFNVDGRKNLQGQKLFKHPNGRTSYELVDFVIGTNFILILKVVGVKEESNDNGILDTNISIGKGSKVDEDQQCKYIKIKIYKDFRALLSISEFICLDELPNSVHSKIEEECMSNTTSSSYSIYRKSNDNILPLSMGKVKIMSYNTWNYNSPWKNRRNYMIDVIEQSHPDVIAVQELRYCSWVGENITKFTDNKSSAGEKRNQAHHLWTLLLLRGLKYQFTFTPSMMYSNQEDIQVEGLGIFSSHPILETSSMRLSRDIADRDDEHQRTCIRAQVSINSQYPINIFTSHFSLGAVAKLRNAKDTFEYMGKFTKPQVFLGDLNSEPNEEPIQFLSKEFKDTWVESLNIKKNKLNIQEQQQQSPDQGFTFPILEGNPTKRIDFIFRSYPSKYDKISLVTSKFKISGDKPTKETYPSDHLSVMTEFEIVSNK